MTNWVSQRLDCRPKDMFDKLREIVSSHTAERQARADPGYRYKMLSDQGPDTFRVIRTSGHPMFESEVTFTRRGDGLGVTMRVGGLPEPRLLDVTIQRQSDSACMFVIDGETLTPEQVSERALTDLFFPD